MKKRILGASLLVSVMSFAQIDIRFSETRFGVLAGGNYSGVRNAHNPSGKRIGLQAGAMALIPADHDDMLYLQTEVEYHQAGETGYNKAEGGNKETKYYNDYISVPIYVKGYFSEAESEFFALGGPYFNFLLNQKVEKPSRDYYAIDKYGKANSFNWGIGLGLGFSYRRQLELTLKYDLGLSDTYPDLKNMPKEVTKKKSEQAISIGVSYIFK